MLHKTKNYETKLQKMLNGLNLGYKTNDVKTRDTKRGINPDFELDSVVRGQNERKSNISGVRHSITMVNELNAGKRLILNHFELRKGIQMLIPD